VWNLALRPEVPCLAENPAKNQDELPLGGFSTTNLACVVESQTSSVKTEISCEVLRPTLNLRTTA